jgi:AcrR family transcriptional regulator
MATRRRSARAIENDAAIREAAIMAIARRGVDSLSLRDAGTMAGLTHGATYARYEDSHEMLVDVWQSRLGPRAVQIFEMCARAVSHPNEDTVKPLIELARRPEAEDAAMVEALMVSRRNPVLLEAVEPFIQKYLVPDDALTATSARAHTRTLCIFALTLVCIFEEYHFDPDLQNLETLERVLTATLAHTGEVELNLDDVEVLVKAANRDESLKSRLAHATSQIVGSSGYYGATISRIARRVECSPGAVYKFFRSKEELTVFAFRRIVVNEWIEEHMFGRILDSAAIAKLLSHEASTESALRRYFTLETVLAAVHIETLKPAILDQLRDPGGYVNRLPADDRQPIVAQTVRSIARMAKGVRWLAVLSPTTGSIDFSDTAEAFRVALKQEESRAAAP